MSSAVRGDRCDGFTLIETSIALVVIALVAVLALPFVRPEDTRAGLAAKAHQVAAQLRLDRAAALRNGVVVTSRLALPGPVFLSGSSRATVDLSRGLAVRGRGEGRGYSFYPDGRSSGGEITLSTRADALMVAIDDVTSAVTVRTATAGRR